MFGHLDKAAFKKKKKKRRTLACFTLKPSSCEGLEEKATSTAFVCDRCPGVTFALAVMRGGYTEIHSLFAGNPDRAFWSGHAALAPGPALAVAVGGSG